MSAKKGKNQVKINETGFKLRIRNAIFVSGRDNQRLKKS
jgi:hypothetical protein